MGTFDPDANQRRITKDLAVVGAGAFAASMASAGIALTAAGALGAAGIASAAIAMAGATALAAVAVVAAAALTVQSLALMLCFGCTVGYGLGGLGTSSFNNIHWNESSARAGAVVGGVVQVVAIVAAANPGLFFKAGLDLLQTAALSGFSRFSRSNIDFRWYGEDAINAINVRNFAYSYVQSGIFEYAVKPRFGCDSNISCLGKFYDWIF